MSEPAQHSVRKSALETSIPGPIGQFNVSKRLLSMAARKSFRGARTKPRQAERSYDMGLASSLFGPTPVESKFSRCPRRLRHEVCSGRKKPIPCRSGCSGNFVDLWMTGGSTESRLAYTFGKQKLREGGKLVHGDDPPFLRIRDRGSSHTKPSHVTH